MKPVAASLPVPISSQKLANASMKPSIQQIKAATNTMEVLLKGKPASDREDGKYLAEMIEAISYCTPEEHGWLTHPRQGLHTRLKFLPTPADVFEFIREQQAKRDQVKATHPSDKGPYAYFRKTDVPQPPPTARRQQVASLLGYDPDAKRAPKRTRNADLMPPTADDIETALNASKIPPQPASPFLKRYLAESGYVVRDNPQPATTSQPATQDPR
jgi:hypothetical protein